MTQKELKSLEMYSKKEKIISTATCYPTDKEIANAIKDTSIIDNTKYDIAAANISKKKTYKTCKNGIERE